MESFQDGVLPSTASPTCDHSSCLSLTEVRRDQAGVYVCQVLKSKTASGQKCLKLISQANNGVGAPAHGRVALSVLFPPTIRFNTDILTSPLSQFGSIYSWSYCLGIPLRSLCTAVSFHILIK